FITANIYGEANLFKGYRAGAVDYIYKPINPELLRVKVSVLVDLYRKNRQLLAQEQKLVSINKSLEQEIHERKVSEEKITSLNRELVENIARLESANKDLDLFAFMASHDLQAPLRKVRMFSDRLSSKYHDVLDEDGKLYLDRIQEVCKRMQGLVNDILEFSKISSDNERFEDVDLNELIQEVLAEMEQQIQDKHAKITIEKLPRLNVNPALIRPLFINLISNALKYSNKGIDPVIRISSDMKCEDQATDDKIPALKYCRIMVTDNGIGFDQKYAEEIFHMFRRLHPSTLYEGTGIGLALAKQIVHKHHGFISARSEINRGTTIIISLPVKDHSSQPVQSSFLTS
ncbi:MAG TPA: ATP-binding protein, partial [Puia sp.]|nr:ATP-binding protein [Puia sp.]